MLVFPIDRIFSSPLGDIRLGPSDLERPFLLAPETPHPSLTLGDYFNAMEHLLLKEEGRCLLHVLMAATGKEWDLDAIHWMGIRSEKHGALYHIASVEVVGEGKRVKFAVATGLSRHAASSLAHEHEILWSLYPYHHPPYIPRVFDRGDVVYSKGHGAGETMTLMLYEWFEGYHEWHYTVDPSDQRQKVSIWNTESGYRHASQKETFEIFRQVSRILTLYYDPLTFRQIHPWRYAAGDFVVKTGRHGVQVRLTTVRDCRSIMDFFSDDPVDPRIAMVYFFLNLTVRVRVDRLDGVGDVVWAEDLSLKAAIQGFFDALGEGACRGVFPPHAGEEIISLLRSLNRAELERLFDPLLSFYEEDSPDELPVIQAHLDRHLHLLHGIFLKYP